jgi:pilus assembly protein CpaB
MKQKLLLVAALFFGVLAFILTYYQIKIERDKALGAAQKVTLVKMKVTKVEDDKIGVNDLEAVETKRFIIDAKRNPEVEWKDRNDIIGKSLDVTVEKGEVLKWYQIKTEKSGRGEGLAAIISKPRDGKYCRAISISVDTTSSVTNLVKPGHYVDIIGTFRFPEMKGDKSLDTLTLTILQCVHVLATGTQMANSSGSDAKGATRSYSTVTLEVTPKEAEMLIFASQKGRLTLTLRNYEDSAIIKDLQSINFKYLEDHVSDYMKEREDLIFGTGASSKGTSSTKGKTK